MLKRTQRKSQANKGQNLSSAKGHIVVRLPDGRLLPGDFPQLRTSVWGSYKWCTCVCLASSSSSSSSKLGSGVLGGLEDRLSPEDEFLLRL